MTTQTLTLTAFLLERLAEDEAAARACAEAFPSPWEVSDRGWRVRIYAADVPDIGDHAEAGDMRSPCVIEVEPDRHHTQLNEGGWLSDRVEHIARHDPDRVLADVEAKRAIIAGWHHFGDNDEYADGMEHAREEAARHLAAVYASHPDYRDEWRP